MIFTRYLWFYTRNERPVFVAKKNAKSIGEKTVEKSHFKRPDV